MCDYALYKAYYCGLCKALQSSFGLHSQYLLNYDCTFMAIFLSALQETDTPPCEPGSCLYVLFKKIPMAKKNNVMEYCAAVNVLLAYYKFYDDWNDEKKVLSGISYGLYKSAAKKAARMYPETNNAIKNGLAELEKLEKEKCESVDIVANSFGELMKNCVCSNKAILPNDLKLCEAISYNIGKWIYLLDAEIDREQDIKKGNYNPFIVCNIDSKHAKILMDIALSEAILAYDLLQLHSNSEILDNIFYEGLYKMMDRHLGECSCKKKKRLDLKKQSPLLANKMNEEIK